VKYDFIDRFSHLNSPLHRRDPRAKIAGVLFAVIVIASTPRGPLEQFAGFYLLIAALVAVSRIPLRFVGTRCLVASPFIVMAALLPFLSLWVEGAAAVAPGFVVPDQNAAAGQFALSVLLKAYAAIILLTLLTSTSRFDHLLWGLRRLKAPEILHVIATLMYRYIFILLDEWRRTTQARQIRTPRGLRVSRISLFGKHVALVFIRGWERAERVQAAMTVRGFRGEFPLARVSRFQAADALFVVLMMASFLGVRLAMRG
jgi:cobalt/nickel transport system permease protein